MSRISYGAERLYFHGAHREMWRTLPLSLELGTTNWENFAYNPADPRGGTEPDLMLGGLALACITGLAPLL